MVLSSLRLMILPTLGLGPVAAPRGPLAAVGAPLGLGALGAGGPLAAGGLAAALTPGVAVGGSTGALARGGAVAVVATVAVGTGTGPVGWATGFFTTYDSTLFLLSSSSTLSSFRFYFLRHTLFETLSSSHLLFR